MLSHTGEKRFKCMFCEKAFSQCISLILERNHSNIVSVRKLLDTHSWGHTHLLCVVVEYSWIIYSTWELALSRIVHVWNFERSNDQSFFNTYIVQTLTLWALAWEFGQYNHLSPIQQQQVSHFVPSPITQSFFKLGVQHFV